ncbi:MAG: hypothetical protein AB7J32_19910 [Pseudonocardia sp.]
MSGPVRGFRGWYGAHPAHLLAMACLGLLTWYAVTRVLADGVALGGILLWFVAAAVLHDALVVPTYAAADLALQGRLRRRDLSGPRRGPAPRIGWTNHVRVPVGLSALLFAVWFPLILGGRAEAFEAATGLSTGVYLGRWLAVTAVLAAASALLYLVRWVAHR